MTDKKEECGVFVTTKKKKRILYLSRGGQVAGSQRQLDYLLSNLDDRFEPIVFFDRRGPFVDQLSERGVPVITFDLPPWRKFPKGILRYWYAEALVRTARAYDVDLVHSSNLWLSGYMHWIAWRLRIPSVLHVRTPLRVTDIHKHRCAKASAVVAISRRVRRNLLEAKVPSNRIVRIQDSVDLKQFYPISHDQNPLRREFCLDGSIAIGLVGRIEPAKKQLELLRVAESVIKKSSLPVVLCLVGPVHCQDYYAELQQFIAERKLDDHVLMTGQRGDMPAVLNAMDILVTFSGGSIIFEAAACGKPIVALYSNTTVFSKLNYITSRPIFAVQDFPGLTETLLRLLEDPTARMDIGRKAMQWAQRDFDSQRMAEKTQKLYAKLLSGLSP